MTNDGRFKFRTIYFQCHCGGGGTRTPKPASDRSVLFKSTRLPIITRLLKKSLLLGTKKI